MELSVETFLGNGKVPIILDLNMLRMSIIISGKTTIG